MAVVEDEPHQESDDGNDGDHPGSKPPEGNESASEVTGAMEKGAVVAAGSKKRAASPSIRVVAMAVEPVVKRARTEQSHDNDEEEKEDAVNEDPSSEEDTALLEEMGGTPTYLEHEKAIKFFNNEYFYASDRLLRFCSDERKKILGKMTMRDVIQTWGSKEEQMELAGPGQGMSLRH